jgi:hypothetical protein
LAIGPDHEDEYGDNGSHFPSAYLNLNQDENEGHARNAEHVGDENEEDDGVNQHRPTACSYQTRG